MPCERYLIRLIHHGSRKPLPGTRLWTASQLGQESIVKFLRARNRDGYDVYFQPYAIGNNAGYILVDRTKPNRMCSKPCVRKIISRVRSSKPAPAISRPGCT